MAFAAAAIVLIGIGGELFVAGNADGDAGARIGYLYIRLAQLGIAVSVGNRKLLLDKT